MIRQGLQPGQKLSASVRRVADEQSKHAEAAVPLLEGEGVE